MLVGSYLRTCHPLKPCDTEIEDLQGLSHDFLEGLQSDVDTFEKETFRALSSQTLVKGCDKRQWSSPCVALRAVLKV